MALAVVPNNCHIFLFAFMRKQKGKIKGSFTMKNDYIKLETTSAFAMQNLVQPDKQEKFEELLAVYRDSIKHQYYPGRVNQTHADFVITKLVNACEFADRALKNMEKGQAERIHDKLQSAIATAYEYNICICGEQDCEGH